jgi:hypothetical protein
VWNEKVQFLVWKARHWSLSRRGNESSPLYYPIFLVAHLGVIIPSAPCPFEAVNPFRITDIAIYALSSLL